MGDTENFEPLLQPLHGAAHMVTLVDGNTVTCTCGAGKDHAYMHYPTHHSHEVGQSGAWPAKLIVDEVKMVSTAIKIDRELLDKIQQAADERCLGRNLFIRLALVKFLDELIPIDQLTHKTERGNNAQIDQGSGNTAFDRYLGGDTLGLRTPSDDSASPADTDVPGGSGRSDTGCL